MGFAETVDILDLTAHGTGEVPFEGRVCHNRDRQRGTVIPDGRGEGRGRGKFLQDQVGTGLIELLSWMCDLSNTNACIYAD